MLNIIEIENIKIHYKVSGSGKSIILLHGWGCDMSIFDSLYNVLKENFKVYVIDFPGFGRSDTPAEIWGVENYTRILELFVDNMSIENPVLLGHSFGGRVCILYASRNKVNKLILVDSAGIKPNRSLRYYLKVYSYKMFKKFSPLFLGEKKAEELMEKYRKKSGSDDYNNAKGVLRSIFVKVVNEDLKHVMPKITAPTLLIWGENDTDTTVKDAHTMNKLIKDSGLVVLKNAGHYSFLEKLHDFNIILDNFLQEDKIKTA